MWSGDIRGRAAIERHEESVKAAFAGETVALGVQGIDQMQIRYRGPLCSSPPSIPAAYASLRCVCFVLVVRGVCCARGTI